MHFTSTITAVATFLSLASAAPGPVGPSGKGETLFKLKTRSHDPSQNPELNGLYVTGIHTGAGTNDVGLIKSNQQAPAGYLNGTSVQFKFEGATTVPFSLITSVQTEYTTWQAAQLNVGYGDSPEYSQFFFNKNGLQQKFEFYGWRVCHWWHEQPQLFYKGPDSGATQVKSCSDVDLIPEYAP